MTKTMLFYHKKFIKEVKASNVSSKQLAEPLFFSRSSSKWNLLMDSLPASWKAGEAVK